MTTATSRSDFVVLRFTLSHTIQMTGSGLTANWLEIVTLLTSPVQAFADHQHRLAAFDSSCLAAFDIASFSLRDSPSDVYVYSTSLESNAQYQSVLKKLISPQNPDRAGAHSTRDDSMLAEELRVSHVDLEGHHLGHHSSWLLWANFINSSAAHKHDELKKAPAPPLELAKYFRWTNVSESARLQAVHRGMTVAHTMNDGWIKEVVEVKKDLDLAMTILEGVNQRVKAMVTRGTMGAELFSAMESAVRPEESEISLNLAANITDCADVDHA